MILQKFNQLFHVVCKNAAQLDP